MRAVVNAGAGSTEDVEESESRFVEDGGSCADGAGSGSICSSSARGEMQLKRRRRDTGAVVGTSSTSREADPESAREKGSQPD